MGVVEVARAVDEPEATDPLLDEAERDRVREVVLEETLALGEALALLLGRPKEQLEARDAQPETLPRGGPCGSPWRERVDDDADREDRRADEPQARGVAEDERQGDPGERREPTRRRPPRAQAAGRIDEPAAADHLAIELVFDEIRPDIEPRLERSEQHSRAVREEHREGGALVSLQVVRRGRDALEDPGGGRLRVRALADPQEASQREVDDRGADVSAVRSTVYEQVGLRRSNPFGRRELRHDRRRALHEMPGAPSRAHDDEPEHECHGPRGDIRRRGAEVLERRDRPAERAGNDDQEDDRGGTQVRARIGPDRCRIGRAHRPDYTHGAIGYDRSLAAAFILEAWRAPFPRRSGSGTSSAAWRGSRTSSTSTCTSSTRSRARRRSKACASRSAACGVPSSCSRRWTTTSRRTRSRPSRSPRDRSRRWRTTRRSS